MAVGLKTSRLHDDSRRRRCPPVGGIVGSLRSALRHRRRSVRRGVWASSTAAASSPSRGSSRGCRARPRVLSYVASSDPRLPDRQDDRYAVASEDDEVSGIDQVEHAETAYDFSGAGGGTAARTAVPANLGRRCQGLQEGGRMKSHHQRAARAAHRLDEISEALQAFGVQGLTVDRGQRLRPPARPHRGLPCRVHVDLVPKIRIEVLVEDDDAEQRIDVVSEGGSDRQDRRRVSGRSPPRLAVRVRPAERARTDAAVTDRSRTERESCSGDE